MLKRQTITNAIVWAMVVAAGAMPGAVAKVDELATLLNPPETKAQPAEAPMMNMPGCNMSMLQMNGMGSPAVFSDEFDWKVVPEAPLQAGKQVTLLMSVRRKSDGQPLSDLELVHDKPCHLVIVSRDLKYFQHIHPEIIAPGKMRIATKFVADGQYVLYMQFKVRNQGDYTLKQDLQVGGGLTDRAKLVADGFDHNSTPVRFDATTSDAWLEDRSQVTSGPYRLKMSAPGPRTNRQAFLIVNIEHDGKPVDTIEPFLSTGGHGVMISDDLTQFLHFHPYDTLPKGMLYKPPLRFYLVRVNRPGLYRVWLQFKIDGKMVIGAWTLDIKD